MIKLFRMKNRNGGGWWVFAETMEEAKTLSVLAGHAKHVDNVKPVVGVDRSVPVGEQTEFYRNSTNMDDVLEMGLKGTASLWMPSNVWCVNGIITGGENKGKHVTELQKHKADTVS